MCLFAAAVGGAVIVVVVVVFDVIECGEKRSNESNSQLKKKCVFYPRR